ncbi:helix-turn-helix domain-containing protein [Rubinisphaera margarita]|uniref:helix-turn-helix domain-containing protein n=1 Tax=Rubinisphaera margarita TaxID=2909586 RepID=UPI0036F43DCA
MTKKKRSPLFERLARGLEEGIEHAKGERELRTTEVPEAPPEIAPQTLSAIRLQTRMSQAMFAKLFSVSTKTIQSWEQGSRKPSESSLRLIEVFSQHPEILCRTVGIPEITLKGVEIRKQPSGSRQIVVRN